MKNLRFFLFMNILALDYSTLAQSAQSLFTLAHEKAISENVKGKFSLRGESGEPVWPHYNLEKQPGKIYIRRLEANKLPP